MTLARMNIGVVSVDSRIPNLALMRLSAWHKSQGDSVEVAQPLLGVYDRVYRSKVFTFSDDEREIYGDAEIVDGGTGYDLATKLGDDIEATPPDYSLFGCDHGIGFTTRGCIRRCRFCAVPEKEGDIRIVGDLSDIVRPEHKWAMLLDNNLTAAPEHLEHIMRQSRELHVKVDITQAMDARLVTGPLAKSIASGNHYASVRFSADDPKNDSAVLRGVRRVVDAGVRPSRIMLFNLIGAPWLDLDESISRIEMFRAEGLRPFAMPYKSLDGTFDASGIPFVKQAARWCNRQELVNVTWDDYSRGIPKAALLRSQADIA